MDLLTNALFEAAASFFVEEECSNCQGGGVCPDCMGEGDEDCLECEGTGDCNECDGTGYI